VDDAPPAAAGDVPELEMILAHARAIAGERAPLAEQLARAAYRRVIDSPLRDVSPDVAAQRIAAAAAFMGQRTPGSLAIRLSDPPTDRGTVVEINVEDSPFLLTTVQEELARMGLEPVDLLHPIVGCERDEAGGIRAITSARGAARRESYMRLALPRRLTEQEKAGIEERLRAVLTDALAATRDFKAMVERVGEVTYETRASAGSRYPPDDVDEALALLRWLLDDHLILLGYREYDLLRTDEGLAAAVRRGSGLGVLRDEASSSLAHPVPVERLPAELRERVEHGELLVVSRTNRRSTVHRQVRMVYVGVKKVSGEGAVAGEHRFLGLFGQKAYSEPAGSIPVLRRKLREVLEHEDVVEGSYDERVLVALFEAMPLHELFQADTDDLRRTLVRLLEASRRQEVRVLVRTYGMPRSAAVVVSLPRGRFNAAVRQRIQSLLTERFEATSVDYHLSMMEGDQPILHFVLHTGRREMPTVPADALEQEVRRITRTWHDDLFDALVAAHGADQGRRLLDRYGPNLPAGYAGMTPPTIAVRDIGIVEALLSAGSEDHARIALWPGTDGAGDQLRFKLYKLGEGVELSTFLPILESLGFTVVEQIPHHLSGVGDEGGAVHIHDFGVRLPAGPDAARSRALRFDLERDGTRVAEAAEAVWDGRAEADSLNRLVIIGGLTWQDVAVLRAYRRYRRQVGTSFTEAYQNEALCAHPAVASALVELFAERFDPARAGTPDRVARAGERVLTGCEAVERLDEDRILRGYLGMVEATVRTNRYVPRPRPCLALKLDSARVPDMPKPVPHVEVFVYSPEMEGIHLRGGPVARGGIRWSDRLEDFRTEILGLMKAQVVKNAVIVPTGAKGGFVVKRPLAGEALAQEVRRQYVRFIRSLLDVTDNVAGGDVVHPEDVRPADGPDPYLVVAADRGTAAFSDAANAVSDEYGYWLGDAFASGGSRGYDHKSMGITARGVWVAVQRHFRELDIDVQSESITVVGIGDMSGDVFGNGMLQSDRIKLVAAFDHRDIFLDPDPDPAVAYRERARLQQLSRSSWRDYDRSRISPGGGVWPRSVKRIPLSGEARRLLRVEVEALTPPDLVKAILRAQADLLFAGGVGTFIKASTETHADAGDRANDAVRIDADEVGARVVGEGGNLALTQAARIQYARRGGRCNTDFIDNAAGVDTSDHEVNLKILLDAAVRGGELDSAERDGLLAEVADDVAAGVLRNVYLQTWAISQELVHSAAAIRAYEALMADLEAPDRSEQLGGHPIVLDRSVEGLPSTAGMEQRTQAGAGLTRPEVAVLLSYAKIELADGISRSPLPDDPALRPVLEEYFPAAAVRRVGHLLDEHRLKRELVATVLANDVVNRMGATYAHRTAHELGVASWEVAAAYHIALLTSDANGYWRAIDDLESRIQPSLQLDLKAAVDRIVDVFARHYVRAGAAHRVKQTAEADRPTFEELEKVVTELGSPRRRAARRSRADRYVDVGIDPGLAERVAALSELTLVPDVSAVARSGGQPVRQVAEVFLLVTDAFELDRVQRLVQQVEPASQWETWHQRGLIDELRLFRREAADRVLQARPDLLADEAVQHFLEVRGPAYRRSRGLVERVAAASEPDLAALAVVVRALRELLLVPQ
jgi:glutamate dehydrogenase